MSDRLAALLERFSVTAQVFQAGALCGVNLLEAEAGLGQLHLIRHGAVEVFHGNASHCVEVPSLLLYPRPMSHRFVTDPVRGADMTCANVRFDGGASNPIAASLPEFICLPLDAIDGAPPVLDLLFDEAFAQRCGRHALVNRLFEALMVLILRQLMERGEVRGGMLAGMSHPRLRHALVAMHESPAREWTLDDLAATAGMSRSVFAGAFRETLGITPGQYLQGWRVSLAQQALRQDRPLKVVAADVGYGSEAALSRAFKAHVGLAPREWKRVQASS
ncbi:cupin domain-containing protein [Pseudoxanthomonas sp.]|uniref:cupin domain-containing protein n=1 Tax=Pseudoxanthomonas sp. TaxID=1871049 RepID=UPI003F7E8FEC